MEKNFVNNYHVMSNLLSKCMLTSEVAGNNHFFIIINDYKNAGIYY